MHVVLWRTRDRRRIRKQGPVLLQCVQTALVEVAQHELLEVVEQRWPEALLEAVAEHSEEALGTVSKQQREKSNSRLVSSNQSIF